MAIQVEVTVRPDGTTVVEINGVQGPSCSIQTGAIIRALEGEVVSDVKKPEFYQTTKDSDKQKEGW